MRAALTREDDYATLGKPPCDWDDPKAREALGALDGHDVDGSLAEAADLLAVVAGQDVEPGDDGVFRIAHKVARDRLISTVDVEARHGHKSPARTFDGYRTHLGVDPDDELITNGAVTAANTPDRQVLGELLDEPGTDTPAADTESATGEPAGNTGDDSDSDSQGDLEPKDFEVYGGPAEADHRAKLLSIPAA